MVCPWYQKVCDKLAYTYALKLYLFVENLASEINLTNLSSFVRISGCIKHCGAIWISGYLLILSVMYVVLYILFSSCQLELFGYPD